MAASRADPFLETSKGRGTRPGRASPSPLSTATGPPAVGARHAWFAPNSREGVHGGRGICTTDSILFYSRLGPHGYQPSAGQDTMLERDGMLPRQLPGTESREQSVLCARDVFYGQIPFPSCIDHCRGVLGSRIPSAAAHPPSLIFSLARSRNGESGMRISTSAGPVCHSRISPRPRLSAQRPLPASAQNAWINMAPSSRRFSASSYSSYKVGFSPALPSFDLPFDLPYPVPPIHTYYPSYSRQQCLHGTRRNVSLRPETRPSFPHRCYQTSRRYHHHG